MSTHVSSKLISPFTSYVYCNFLKNILSSPPRKTQVMAHSPTPPLQHYMLGKYVLNEIRLGARYLAVECHLARICSLDGNEGYEHKHLKEKTVIA